MPYLNGNWTYRSFLSDPDPNTPFNDLRFAIADITVDQSEDGEFSGRLQFGEDYLSLRGWISYGHPFLVRFQGLGATPGTIEQGQPWIYDYTGFVVPQWPNGVNQRFAIVGTIVRTVPHSQGRAKAGVVAQWIAVRKDPVRWTPKAGPGNKVVFPGVHFEGKACQGSGSLTV